MERHDNKFNQIQIKFRCSLGGGGRHVLSEAFCPCWRISWIVSLSGPMKTQLAQNGQAGQPGEYATWRPTKFKHFIGVMHSQLRESDAQRLRCAQRVQVLILWNPWRRRQTWRRGQLSAGRILADCPKRSIMIGEFSEASLGITNRIIPSKVGMLVSGASRRRMLSQCQFWQLLATARFQQRIRLRESGWVVTVCRNWARKEVCSFSLPLNWKKICYRS